MYQGEYIGTRLDTHLFLILTILILYSLYLFIIYIFSYFYTKYIIKLPIGISFASVQICNINTRINIRLLTFLNKLF